MAVRRIGSAAFGVLLVLATSMTGQTAWAQADSLGSSWQVCETSAAYGKICGTWTRNGDGTWSGNGDNKAIMALTITASGTSVSVSRSDPAGPSAGLSASYTGTVASDYRTASGQVTWESMAGRATGTTGTWDATITGATPPVVVVPTTIPTVVPTAVSAVIPTSVPAVNPTSVPGRSTTVQCVDAATAEVAKLAGEGDFPVCPLPPGSPKAPAVSCFEPGSDVRMTQQNVADMISDSASQGTPLQYVRGGMEDFNRSLGGSGHAICPADPPSPSTTVAASGPDTLAVNCFEPGSTVQLTQQDLSDAIASGQGMSPADIRTQIEQFNQAVGGSGRALCPVDPAVAGSNPATSTDCPDAGGDGFMVAAGVDTQYAQTPTCAAPPPCATQNNAYDEIRARSMASQTSLELIREYRAALDDQYLAVSKAETASAVVDVASLAAGWPMGAGLQDYFLGKATNTLTEKLLKAGFKSIEKRLLKDPTLSGALDQAFDPARLDIDVVKEAAKDGFKKAMGDDEGSSVIAVLDVYKTGKSAYAGMQKLDAIRAMIRDADAKTLTLEGKHATQVDVQENARIIQNLCQDALAKHASPQAIYDITNTNIWQSVRDYLAQPVSP